MGNDDRSIDKLQSWEIGVESISAPSLKKIPGRLSKPAAFDVLVFFKISKTVSCETQLKLKILFPMLIYEEIEVIPNLFDGFGRFNRSLLASSLKNVLKISALVLESKDFLLLLFSSSRQILDDQGFFQQFLTTVKWW